MDNLPNLPAIQYAEIHEEFSNTNRLCIEHTEWSIVVITQTSVFCVDETCFLKHGDIYKINYLSLCTNM